MMWFIVLSLIVQISDSARKLFIPLLSEEPVVDGKVDDVWIREGYKVSQFLEVAPRDSAKPEVETKVYAGYKESNLYLLFICEENSEIRSTLLKRDDFRQDNDWALVEIDPENSGTRSYWFALNPLEVQCDWIITSSPTGEIFDPSFDFIWEGKAHVGKKRWIAEFKISLDNFNKISKDEFRISFARIRPRSTLIQYVWPPLKESSTDVMGYGIFTGQISSSWRNEALPYILLVTKSPFSRRNTSLRTGLTTRIMLPLHIKLLAAINPDFSTIETDAFQITVNNPYVPYFPEKRPVFLEGRELFEREELIVYTRRINDPSIVLKLTGKIGKEEFGLITAFDRKNSIIIPSSYGSYEIPTGDSSFVNSFRWRHIFRRGTYMGVFLNSRTKMQNFRNSVSYFEGGMDIKNHYCIDILYGHSWTEEYKEKKEGEHLSLKFSAIFADLNLFAKYYSISPQFRNFNGYLQKVDFIRREAGISWSKSLNYGILTHSTITSVFSRGSNYKRENICDSMNLSINALIKAQTYLEYNLNMYSTYFLNFNINNIRVHQIYIKSDPFGFLSFYFFFNWGDGINFFSYPPEKAKLLLTGANVEIKFSQKFMASVERKQYILKSSIPIYNEKTYYIKFEYIPKTNIYFRWIFRIKDKELGIYPLFSLKLTPYNFLYLGGNIEGNLERKMSQWDKVLFFKIQQSINLF